MIINLTLYICYKVRLVFNDLQTSLRQPEATRTINKCVVCFFLIVAYLCKVEVGHINNACPTDTQPNMAFIYRCDACPFIS